MEKVKEEKEPSYWDDFNRVTASLFSKAEGKEWLRLLKKNPDIRYYYSSLKSGGKDLDGLGLAFYDGAQMPIRIIEQIMDNQK